MLHKLFFGGKNELVRKTQHVSYSLSIFLLIKLFSSWYSAVLAASLLVVVGYPALLYLEKLPFYKKYFVDRKKKGGELRMQLLLVNATFGLLLFIFWGLLGIKWLYIAPVAVMAWGFGDAAAAVIGKAFGRRRIKSPFIDGAKTYAGTIAMAIVAFLAVLLTLLFYAGKSFLVSLITALLVAPVCAIVELYSPKGTDTITVPFAAATVILPLMFLFQMWGW
jgi:phytol kinase